MKAFNLVFTCSLFLLFLLFPHSSIADPIDSNTAMAAAKNFFAGKQSLRSGNSAEEPVIVRIDKGEEENYFYVLQSPSQNGWVIIAGNDEITPVIAYSDEGQFNQSGSRNENFEYWMDCMKQEINFILSKNAGQLRSATPSKAKKEWEALLSNNSNQLRSATAAPIPRLLGGMAWSQNNTFPGEGLTYDKYTPNNWPAGCVAIAMAQIVKYQYSKLGTTSLTGVGSKSYTASSHPELGVLSANFGATTYNFANMPDQIWDINAGYMTIDDLGPVNVVPSPTTAIDEVARFIYHIGVSVGMNYGPNVSGSNEYAVQNALKSYFKYHPCTQINKSGFGGSWENTILSELQAGRPVYYSGDNPNLGGSGHAFVVDGYDGTNKYHFNWGWGGDHNGHFLLSLTDLGIDPSVAYSDGQAILIGLIPNSQPAIAVTGISLSHSTITLKTGTGLQLTETLAPVNAMNKAVTWTSSSAAVAVSGGYIYAMALGTATITVTTADGSKTATCNVLVSNQTGVDNVKEIVFNVFPSIVDNYVHVDIPAKSEILIYDLSGILVKSVIAESDENQINISDLKPGMYIIRTTAGQAKILKK